MHLHPTHMWWGEDRGVCVCAFHHCMLQRDAVVEKGVVAQTIAGNPFLFPSRVLMGRQGFAHLPSCRGRQGFAHLLSCPERGIASYRAKNSSFLLTFPFYTALDLSTDDQHQSIPVS